MRPTTLVRSAAAAALVCLTGSSAFASDEATAAEPVAQPSSFVDRLASDEPLFLIDNGANGTASGDMVRMGVLRDWRGKTFAINAKEGEEMLRVGFLAQFRGMVGYYDEIDNGDEEIENGFEFNYLQANASGRVPNANLGYYLMIEYQNGLALLSDAYATWHPTDARWGLRVGQYRDPESLEWLINEGGQLSSERSLAHFFFNGFPPVDDEDFFSGGNNRVQGVSLIGAPNDRFRYEVSFHDGANSANTPFSDTFSLSDLHFGISSRIEFLLQGDDWHHYKGFSAMGMENGPFMGVGVGASMTWSDGSDRIGHLTGDLLWKQDRLSIFAALHLLNLWVFDDDFMNYGGVAQVAYAVNDNMEPFGRLSIVMIDDDLVTNEDTFLEFTAGINFYPIEGLRNRLRVTTDVTLLPDGSPVNIPKAGYVASEELQALFRTQAELKL